MTVPRTTVATTTTPMTTSTVTTTARSTATIPCTTAPSSVTLTSTKIPIFTTMTTSQPSSLYGIFTRIWSVYVGFWSTTFWGHVEAKHKLTSTKRPHSLRNKVDRMRPQYLCIHTQRSPLHIDPNMYTSPFCLMQGGRSGGPSHELWHLSPLADRSPRSSCLHWPGPEDRHECRGHPPSGPGIDDGAVRSQRPDRQLHVLAKASPSRGSAGPGRPPLVLPKVTPSFGDGGRDLSPASAAVPSCVPLGSVLQTQGRP